MNQLTQENNNNTQKPLVAIVGRPNVGKSTLFNHIIEQNKSIVEDIPGVTRDRVYGEAVWKNKSFGIVDTGGLVIKPSDDNEELIKQQVEVALAEADLILFLMDGKQGLMPGDQDIINYLRGSGKNVLYVINKIDHIKHEINSYDFHQLGIEKFLNISALHNRNTYELIDLITENLPDFLDYSEDSNEENCIQISVIGKPNVGKSTLVNAILGEKRFITSPVPGTTRDAIDTQFELNGNKYLIIDTAGIRRKSKVSELLERYSVLRAIKAMTRSDVVLFMMDASEGPTHHDARLGDLVKNRGIASIVLLNKWDLAPPEVREIDNINELTIENLKSLDYSPVLKTSALTGKKINKIFDLVDNVYQNYTKKIKTKELNQFLDEIKKKNPPGMHKGKELKFYYITQPYTKPPTFVLFSNAKNRIPDNYKKYIENQLREYFDFTGTPIKLIFRTRADEKN